MGFDVGPVWHQEPERELDRCNVVDEREPIDRFKKRRVALESRPGVERHERRNQNKPRTTTRVCRALDIPEDGYFVIVSQVVPRDSAASNSPGALSLAARIRPLLLVRPPDAEGDLAVFELTADQFYPSFARILF